MGADERDSEVFEAAEGLLTVVPSGSRLAARIAASDSATVSADADFARFVALEQQARNETAAHANAGDQDLTIASLAYDAAVFLATGPPSPPQAPAEPLLKNDVATLPAMQIDRVTHYAHAHRPFKRTVGR